jgi:protein BUR2
MYDFLKKYDVANNKVLRDTSWAFINDTNMTHICLLFPSRAIAVAAIYCGAKKAGVSFPDDEYGRPWWETQKVKGIDMRRAFNHMVSLFENQTLRSEHERNYVGNSTPLDVDEQFAKTRLRREQAPDTPQPIDISAYNSMNSMNEGNGESGAPPPPRSRIPAAAQLESRPAKRFKANSTEPNANGGSTKETDNGSEEGELEE